MLSVSAVGESVGQLNLGAFTGDRLAQYRSSLKMKE